MQSKQHTLHIEGNYPSHTHLNHHVNESTAGADASVEVPKLHNIKLLIASFYYTNIDYEFCCMQSTE